MHVCNTMDYTNSIIYGVTTRGKHMPLTSRRVRCYSVQQQGCACLHKSYPNHSLCVCIHVCRGGGGGGGGGGEEGVGVGYGIYIGPRSTSVL